MKRIAAAIAGLIALATSVAAEPRPIPQIGPDELAFSVENMDKSVDPGVDFYRYASGKWLDRVQRPERLPSIGVFDFMSERLKAQMVNAITKAAADASSARKGSPVQQVGDLYSSYMDVVAIDALGMSPLQPELDRIDAIASFDDLATYAGHYARIAGDTMLAAIVPSVDRADSTRIALYFVSGQLLVQQRDIYAEPDDAPRVVAYLAFLRDALTIAGYDADRADRMARLTLDLERAFYAGQITPIELVDPRNSYNPATFAEVQTQIPEMNLSRVAAGLGISAPEILILTEPRYLPVLSQLLRSRPLDDFKDYARVKLITKFMPYLSTRFDAPTRALTEALLGVAVLPPREERAQDLLRTELGHPVSKVYVDGFFSEVTRTKAIDMTDRIRKEFLARMQTRKWLSEPTRRAAIDKLERLTFLTGYPDTWIDFSSIDIGSEKLVANVSNLIAFDMGRDLAKLGKPVVRDQFNNSRATLPIIINAAYGSQMNGFEVPAAILQPAAFEADKDAPVYFCRMGAVLGHEMTHGFDSGGRLFDASGNLRDWWTPQDAAAFEKEAQKLIDQANSFEVLPGLRANGALNVKENMADVGGINLAYGALVTYLAEYPAEDVVIDGMTPAQRCFVSWTQMWTFKATEQFVRNQVNGDFHPPGNYRAVAALQHVDAFYDAFGIVEGDPMWLAPEKRVNAW